LRVLREIPRRRCRRASFAAAQRETGRPASELGYVLPMLSQQTASRKNAALGDQMNDSKVEMLKAWYAVFTTLIDADEYDDKTKLEKLKKLRLFCANEAPDLEALMQRVKQ
jgi:hypothetical protein